MKRLLGLSAVFVSGLLIGMTGTAIGAGVLGSARFRDVPAGSYYDAAVGRLTGMDIIRGVDGQFFPERTLNRAELSVILDRLLTAIERGDYGTRPSEGGTTSSVTRTSSSRSRSSSRSSLSLSSSSAPASSTAGVFRFTTESFSVGAQVKKISVSVLRTTGSKGAVRVDYSFGGGTAVSGVDYSASAGTLNFAEGETSKTIQVNLVGTITSNKTIDVTLANPTGGAVLGSPAKLTITVLAGSVTGSSSSGTSSGIASSSSATVQGAGLLGFNASAFAVRENAGTVTITVSRTGGSTGAVGVNYATSNGSASEGSHYRATTGTLSFAAGETSKSFTIPVIDNGEIGGNKTVNLSLTSVTGGAGISVPTAVLTIIDEEAISSTGSGVLIFNPNTYNVTEGVGSVAVTVVRQFNFANTVTVSYNTTDGSAVAGSDYTNTNGTFTFLPGESAKVISVPILRDEASEGPEYLSVLLTNPTGAGLGAQSAATINIQ